MRKICNIAGVAVLGLSLWHGVPASGAWEPGVYFKEDFRNYRDKAPECVDDAGLVVGNDPIWNPSAQLDCRPATNGLVFKEFVPSTQMVAGVTSYDILFRFRFLDRPGQFQLWIHNTVGAGAGDIRLDISSNAVTAASEGISPEVTGSGALPATIPKSEWHRCAVTVQGGQLTVRVDNNRLYNQVLATNMPALPMAGINFYAYTNTPFSITDIVVRDPTTLADNNIANILPTPVPLNPGDYQAGVTQAVATNDWFGATLLVGAGVNTARLTLEWSGGKSNVVYFGTTNVTQSEINSGLTLPRPLSNGIIRVTSLPGAASPLNVYIRPRLRRYTTSYSYTDTYVDIIRDWDLLPKASEHPLKVEFRRTNKGYDCYLDSCYASSMTGSLQRVTFTLTPAASIGKVFSQAYTYAPEKYLPLDIAALAMAKSCVAATNSMAAGFTTVNGVPMFVASGAGSADIGLAREGQGQWALEVDEYLMRSPFDGLLTEIHFAVPGFVPYTKAWVLCAVDPDSSKVPVLTTRLTRYAGQGSGNNVMADTLTALPRVSQVAGQQHVLDVSPPAGTLVMIPAVGLPAGVEEVGTVTTTNKDGQAVQVPLYLVEVPLKSGQIIDLCMGQTNLNFEFFGKPWENYEQMDYTGKPDPKSTSAVQIFGVTLEKSPVGLRFVQSQPGNVFHNSEVPETTAVLSSLAPANGTLSWEIFADDGHKAGSGSASYSFSQTGQVQQVTIPLAMSELGWYDLRVTVADGDGNPLIVHPASFALLGPDTRQAHYESPYGVWWFDGVHDTPTNLDFAGSIMFKAGIRCVAWTAQKEAALEKWSLFKDQFNMPSAFSFSKFGTNLAQEAQTPGPLTATAYSNAAVAVSNQFRDYPHTREVLVYHESGPGNDIPLELIGITNGLTAAKNTSDKRYADLLTIVGRFFRARYPQLKMVVGNNSCSQSCIGAILRNGGNPDYIDYIGIEAVSQVFTPEKLQEGSHQGSHFATDIAKYFAGRDIPASGCYEFIGRCERDTGEQQHAEWYARDMLICLSKGFTRIGMGVLFDAGSCYYNTLYAASGLMKRGPFGYPKRAYVAYAVITEVFDRVTNPRQIPTGSSTAYAVEFDRADTNHAAAFWTSRGNADFVVEFAGDTTVTMVDMYGRRRTQATSGRLLTVAAGTSPAYTIADQTITGVTIGARSFPRDMARARVARVAAPLDQAGDITLEADNSLDTPKVYPLQSPIRQVGEFALRHVTDTERGACIELELMTNATPALSKYITEYITLRLNTPAPVSGTPVGMGVWVKGNSSWGRVMFEIEDAEGEVWRSVGTGGWGCDILDWPGNIAFNFDGWSFVALPMANTPLFTDHSPGPVLEQWVSGGGNKTIDCPIKVRAVIVEMNRTPLNLLDFTPARPTIRLQGLSAF